MICPKQKHSNNFCTPTICLCLGFDNKLREFQFYCRQVDNEILPPAYESNYLSCAAGYKQQIFKTLFQVSPLYLSPQQGATNPLQAQTEWLSPQAHLLLQHQLLLHDHSHWRLPLTCAPVTHRTANPWRLSGAGQAENCSVYLQKEERSRR